MRVDWRAGAEWFQWCLADHDVASNWGNWGYFAGVGADPKQRHFRTVSQALKYDPGCAYVRKWLPELDGVDDEAALRPFARAVHGWPAPLVDPATQLTWQDAERLALTGRLAQASPVEVEAAADDDPSKRAVASTHAPAEYTSVSEVK